MTDRPAPDPFEEGAAAGRDIDTQAGDCPYDHDPRGEMQRRQRWLAGFASTRGEAAPADRARDYHEIDPKAPVEPGLPVYFNT